MTHSSIWPLYIRAEHLHSDLKAWWECSSAESEDEEIVCKSVLEAAKLMATAVEAMSRIERAETMERIRNTPEQVRFAEVAS